MKSTLSVVLMGLMLGGFHAGLIAAEPFDVPQLQNIAIDGDLADWNDGGMEVAVLTDGEGRVQPAEDLDANLRLGWNAEGLLLALTVHDDVFVEHDKPNEFWRHDSVSLFLGDAVGGKQWWQANIAPGMASEDGKLRYWIYDRGKNDYDERLKIVAERKAVEGGYVMEALLPWDTVPVEAELGREVGFQVYVTDADTKAEQRFSVHWYPAVGTHNNSANMVALRLAEKAGPAVRARTRGSFHNGRAQACVRVVATPDQAGSKVELLDGEQVVASSELAATDGRAGTEIFLPLPKPGEAMPALAVRVGETVVDTIDLGSADRWRAVQVQHLDPVIAQAVFEGPEFPEVTLGDASRVEQLIGPFELSVTYYGADYAPVTTADKPGRYGAIISATTASGHVHRRFATLYRLPQPLGETDSKDITPTQLGVGWQAVKMQPKIFKELGQTVREGELKYDQAMAITLAGLSETAFGGAVNDWYKHPRKLNRTWWLGLKRKLYGWDERFTTSLARPTKIEGDPAPIVHEGTLEEAGMKPDAAETIDAVLTQWEADTDEAFAVCIVRNGVIVLHKAYGQRDGEPMTVDTQSWMASITKMISGTMLMTAVDQGLLSLDDPVEKYLPPLAGTQQTPWTFRNLYTHTDDLDGHWGSEVNDMEERMVALAKVAKVGQQYRYNGTGLELACKALEAVSGETMPTIYRNRLLSPLELTGTNIEDACGGSRSIPLDMAKIGQMLLSRGAYGQWRFFSEETFQQMLPRSLKEIYGFETDEIYGIGTSHWKDEPLGEGTFAHGAASAATLRIDPVNNLVIVMTRNTAGENFRKYHPLFLQAVVDAMAD